MQNTLTVLRGVLIGLIPYLFLVGLVAIIRFAKRGQVMELGMLGIAPLFICAMIIIFFVGMGLLFSSTRRLLGVGMIAVVIPTAVLFVEGHLYMPN